MQARTYRPLTALVTVLVLATLLPARGLLWDYLGYTQVDDHQDRAVIRVLRSDKAFHVIGLRLAGQAIFFDRIFVYFADGSFQEFVISDRILPGGADYVLHLAGEPRPLERVELRYFQESWANTPRVTLYGVPEAESGVAGVSP